MCIQESRSATRSRPGLVELGAPGGARIVSFRRHWESRVQKQESSAKVAESGAVTTDFAALLGLVASRRDRAAFLDVYEYFAPRVKSFLLGQGVAPAAADDILQEVMLAVWNKAKLFDPKKAAPSTWIFAIARNKRIDRIRRETKPDLDPEEPSLQPSAPDAADDDLMHGQHKTAVAAALTELPEDQRICIELSFMKGLSHGEIAGQLGLPLGTVKSRIRLAFGRLRDELGELR
ncbi:MAG: sigma-70 family RNA polymerase sigma factor [Gammaproteobacteria bacterium]|nr:sigma-70 family RNA polymerase sigma factor [Gammaproteobacteria bacterium]